MKDNWTYATSMFRDIWIWIWIFVQGRWFSPGTPASSTTKTGRHDIAEILLKVALNTKIQIQIHISLNIDVA
jgi:hypothetical protein